MLLGYDGMKIQKTSVNTEGAVSDRAPLLHSWDERLSRSICLQGKIKVVFAGTANFGIFRTSTLDLSDIIHKRRASNQMFLVLFFYYFSHKKVCPV